MVALTGNKSTYQKNFSKKYLQFLSILREFRTFGEFRSAFYFDCTVLETKKKKTLPKRPLIFTDIKISCISRIWRKFETVADRENREN